MCLDASYLNMFIFCLCFITASLLHRFSLQVKKVEESTATNPSLDGQSELKRASESDVIFAEGNNLGQLVEES